MRFIAIELYYGIGKALAQTVDSLKEAYRTKSVSHLGASAQVDAPFSFV